MAASPAFGLSQYVLLVIVFAVVVGGSYFLILRLQHLSLVRRDLRAISVPTQAQGSQQSLRAGRDTAWSRLVERIERSGLDLADSKPDAVRAKLAAAGFTAPVAPRLYSFLRLILVFLVPATLLGIILLSGTELTVFKLYFFGTVGGLVGLYLPALLLQIRADRRSEAMTNGFPNCLDLMLVCVEAGLGLESAFDRVSRELAQTEPLVTELLATTMLHLRAGASREDALRRMASSAGVDEIRSFCTLLIQSDKLGTSIASTLRIYASEMRERRKMRAEEKAHRLPVLISIPLIVCMLPTMIGVLMLPALIMVIRQIVPAMSGG